MANNGAQWYLRRMHYCAEFAVIDIPCGRVINISRSPKSAIMLNTPIYQHISKQHCELNCTGSKLYIRDFGSTSGTFINERKLSRADPAEIVELKEDDLVGIGSACDYNQSWYRENNQSLLYKVCRRSDQSDMVMNNLIEIIEILSSDDEAELANAAAISSAQPEGSKNRFGNGSNTRRWERVDQELSTMNDQILASTVDSTSSPPRTAASGFPRNTECSVIISDDSDLDSADEANTINTPRLQTSSGERQNQNVPDPVVMVTISDDEEFSEQQYTQTLLQAEKEEASCEQNYEEANQDHDDDIQCDEKTLRWCSRILKQSEHSTVARKSKSTRDECPSVDGSTAPINEDHSHTTIDIPGRQNAANTAKKSKIQIIPAPPLLKHRKRKIQEYREEPAPTAPVPVVPPGKSSKIIPPIPISKRRKSCDASLREKLAKKKKWDHPQQMNPHSKISSNEERSKKLREVALQHKKQQSARLDMPPPVSKPTVPKVKITKANRGAFLSNMSAVNPPDPPDPWEQGAPVTGEWDELFLTQSTSVEHIAPLNIPDVQNVQPKSRKLTFDSVAKVSNVAMGSVPATGPAPAKSKIVKRRKSVSEPVDVVTAIMQELDSSGQQMKRRMSVSSRPAETPGEAVPVGKRADEGRTVAGASSSSTQANMNPVRVSSTKKVSKALASKTALPAGSSVSSRPAETPGEAVPVGKRADEGRTVAGASSSSTQANMTPVRVSSTKKVSKVLASKTALPTGVCARKSILKSPNSTSPKKGRKVSFNANLVDIRYYENDEQQERNPGEISSLSVRLEVDRLYSALLCDIIAWQTHWLDPTQRVPINGPIMEKLSPMVEQYHSYEVFKDILMPIMKMELWHDIAEGFKKVANNRSYLNLTGCVPQNSGNRSGHRKLIITCNVESNRSGKVSSNDFTLLTYIVDGTASSVFAYVQSRAYAPHMRDGTAYYECTLVMATNDTLYKAATDERTSWRLLVLSQINNHMRQFRALFSLKMSPLLPNVLDPQRNLVDATSLEDWKCRYRNELDQLLQRAGNEPLNSRQRDALLTMYGQCTDFAKPSIMLMQGPPGTGKSRVISLLALLLQQQQSTHDAKRKILICAQSNTAIDVIVQKLVRLSWLFNDQLSIVRMGTKQKISPACQEVFLDQLVENERRWPRGSPGISKAMHDVYKTEQQTLIKKIARIESDQLARRTVLAEELTLCRRKLRDVEVKLSVDPSVPFDRKQQREARSRIIGNADIICTTLGSSATLAEQYPSLQFDVCIIDEATQSTEVSSLLPFQFGIRKLVLVGDINQLPATVLSMESADAGLRYSLFDRIQKSFHDPNANVVRKLTVQYRMHPEICKWPNEYFYNGELQSAQDETNCDEFPFKPYTVFSLGYSQNLTQMEHHIYNNDEIHFVVKLVTQMTQYLTDQISVAVITPYSRHKLELDAQLARHRLERVNVLSIDSVQGQEYDVVIISLARSIGTGFLNNAQRINVAMTRARKCLVLCGNFTTLRNTPVWSSLLEDADKRKLLYYIDDDSSNNSDVETDDYIGGIMKNLLKS